jgi:hypothetical protein
MDDGIDPASQDRSEIVVATPPSSAPINPEIKDSGRNAVFAALVKNDADITGLVAYSIFKQNELDWLGEFRSARGREPTEAEADSYIIGESTPRRLATYRHLADATLAGKGPEVEGGGATSSGGYAFRSADAKSGGGFSSATAMYIVIAIVVLIGVYFAARYGLPK